MIESVRRLPIVMVVEDCDEDFEALSRVLRTLEIEIRVKRCCSGDECLDLLGHMRSQSESGGRVLPSLILLDLNLPGTDGRDALHVIKTDPHLKLIPVTVLTTSDSPRDVEACYASGANAYVLKSLDYDDMMRTLRFWTDFWLRAAVLPEAAS